MCRFSENLNQFIFVNVNFWSRKEPKSAKKVWTFEGNFGEFSFQNQKFTVKPPPLGVTFWPKFWKIRKRKEEKRGREEKGKEKRKKGREGVFLKLYEFKLL